MVLGAENKIGYTLKYQNRQVRVTLSFPEKTDTKAEQDFVGRLKEAYLEKSKAGTWQKSDLALLSSAAKKMEKPCFGMEENNA